MENPKAIFALAPQECSQVPTLAFSLQPFLSHPSFSVRAFYPVVEFGDVGYFHRRAVPLHFISNPGALSEVAQEGEFGEARAVLEGRGGFGFAGATGLQEVRHDVLGSRQSSRWLSDLVHFLHRQNVHPATVGSGIKNAFFANINGAAG